MNNISELKIGATYRIVYIGEESYQNYDGEGVFTGEITDIDGETCAGFTIESERYVCYFPIDSIFKLETNILSP